MVDDNQYPRSGRRLKNSRSLKLGLAGVVTRSILGTSTKETRRV